MPGARVHVAGGIVFALGCMYTLDVTQPEFILGSIVGSLLPDADHRKAFAGRWVPLWLVCKHRGLTHSLLAFALFSLLSMILLPEPWGLGMAAGYLSHLLLDSMTVSGIPWLYPSRQRYRLLKEVRRRGRL